MLFPLFAAGSSVRFTTLELASPPAISKRPARLHLYASASRYPTFRLQVIL